MQFYLSYLIKLCSKLRGVQQLGIAKIEESAKHSGREYREVPVAAETSWRGVVFRFVFKAKEKAATIGFVTAWFLRGGPTRA